MFKVNGEYWDIVFVEPNHPALKNETIAVTDDSRKKIYISIHVLFDDYLLRKVLYHEITHATMFSYNTVLSVREDELLADLVATYGQEIINIGNELFTKIKNKMGNP